MDELGDGRNMNLQLRLACLQRFLVWLVAEMPFHYLAYHHLQRDKQCQSRSCDGSHFL